tara:strand:+ start:6639 stop:7100 length:462 start_codon:yes stop_codon:yes gene_type:complete
MRYFLLTVILSLFISFSFAQERSMKQKNVQNVMIDKSTKSNSVLLVKQLTEQLKLDKKQHLIVDKAFFNYARNMMMVKDKVTKMEELQTSKGEKAKDSELKNRKYANTQLMRFADLRDKMIKDCLNKKQFNKYEKIATTINPMTLKIEKKVKK